MNNFEFNGVVTDIKSFAKCYVYQLQRGNTFVDITSFEPKEIQKGDSVSVKGYISSRFYEPSGRHFMSLIAQTITRN